MNVCVKKGHFFGIIWNCTKILSKHFCLCSYDYNPDVFSNNAEASKISWREEEQASLQQSLRALQTQFASERAQREELEREAELLANENAVLEQQVSGMEGCRVCPIKSSYVLHMFGPISQVFLLMTPIFQNPLIR